MEYGGTISDKSISASSERDQWFAATRGRLNTPSDVIIIDRKFSVNVFIFSFQSKF